MTTKQWTCTCTFRTTDTDGNNYNNKASACTEKLQDALLNPIAHLSDAKDDVPCFEECIADPSSDKCLDCINCNCCATPYTDPNVKMYKKVT